MSMMHRFAPWLPSATVMVVAVLVGVILGIPIAQPVGAITACGGVLRDGDDLIPADQEGQVQTVTDTTRLAGTQPLIVLLRTSGGRDINGELTEAISTCPVLADDPGSVIAVGITIDDQAVVVHPGIDVAHRIDSDGLAKSMRDQIGHIPLEQVLVSGFTSINEQLYETRGQTTQQPLLTPLAWMVLGVLILLAGGVGGLWLVQNRQVLRQARANAEATRAKGMTVALNLEQDQRALAKQTQDLAEWMAMSEVEPIRRANVEIDLRAYAVLRRWHALVNQMGTAEGFRAESYDRFNEQLTVVFADVQDVADQMMVIQGNLAHIITIIDGIDGRLAAIKDELHVAATAIDLAVGKGWKSTSSQADLAIATVYAQWAQRARDHQEMIGADEFLRVAESKLSASLMSVQHMERTYLDMTQQVDTAAHRHRELEQSLGPAREAMTGLETSFGQRSWEFVAGNGSSAQALLAGIPQQLDAAKAALDMDVQDIDEAAKQLSSIALDLDAAEGLIDAIHETLTGLQHAARLLPDAVRSAERAVETAIQVAHARERDDGIAELKAMRERIRNEQAADKPDLHALIDSAELLTLQADQWVARERGDQAVQEQIERAARSAVEQARLRCAQTAQLVVTHQRALPDSYMQVIEELAEHLDDTVRESVPERQLDLATKVRYQAVAISHEARRVMRTQSRVLPNRDAQSRW
ncbi:hypothetical protein [Stomatohabitans albus]|uniref:hypothetical protein n=1 Tax=Stomatohabitans albus TaxID=3110766 RepID=UPI00300C9397